MHAHVLGWWVDIVVPQHMAWRSVPCRGLKCCAAMRALYIVCASNRMAVAVAAGYYSTLGSFFFFLRNFRHQGTSTAAWAVRSLASRQLTAPLAPHMHITCR